MSDRVLIPWDDPETLFDEPNSPRILKPAWVPDADGLVYLRCACGVILGTLTAHSIDADGTVNASVLHDPSDTRWREVVGPCNWHVFCRLLHWDYGAMVAGQHKIIGTGKETT